MITQSLCALRLQWYYSLYLFWLDAVLPITLQTHNDFGIIRAEQISWITLQWRHNGRDSLSNHQTHDCLFNRLFRRWSKKASKLRVAGICEGNSPVTGEFPAQRASNAENDSILRELIIMCIWLLQTRFKEYQKLVWSCWVNKYVRWNGNIIHRFYHKLPQWDSIHFKPAIRQ